MTFPCAVSYQCSCVGNIPFEEGIIHTQKEKGKKKKDKEMLFFRSVCLTNSPYPCAYSLCMLDIVVF